MDWRIRVQAIDAPYDIKSNLLQKAPRHLHPNHYGYWIVFKGLRYTVSIVIIWKTDVGLDIMSYVFIGRSKKNSLGPMI